MTKTPIPLYVDDLSAFTRALGRQLGDPKPSHVALMNMVARAAGFQNLQHMRAAHAARRRFEAQPQTLAVDMRTVERTLVQFDAEGRLLRWPARRSVQALALWALWTSLPSDTSLDEKEINARLRQEHLFNDPATLRRTMIGSGLLTRHSDGSNYRRVEQAPPEEAKTVIHAVTARRRLRNGAVPA